MFLRNSLRTLKVSIEKENWEDVRDLLKTSRGRESVTYKVYPDVSNRRSKLTALHLACRHGAPLDIVREMLSIRPDLIKMRSEHAGDVPLHYAVFRLANNPNTSSRDVMEHLVRVCPESVAFRSSRAGAFGRAVHPLHVAVLSSSSSELIEALIKACPSASNKRDGEGRKARMIASQTHVCYIGRELERQEVLKILEPDPTVVQRTTQCCLFVGLYLMVFATISIVQALFVIVDRSSVVYSLLIMCEAAAVFYFVDITRTRLRFSEWSQRLTRMVLPASIGAPMFSLRQLAASPSSAASAAATDGGLGLCIVCWDKPLSHVLLPCGHICLCSECASPKCMKDIPRCPVGKCAIQSTKKIYMAGISR